MTLLDEIESIAMSDITVHKTEREAMQAAGKLLKASYSYAWVYPMYKDIEERWMCKASNCLDLRPVFIDAASRRQIKFFENK